MASIFPSNPEVDDEFTSGDTTWIWNGQAWSFIASGTGAEPTQSFVNIVTDPVTQTISAESSVDTLTVAAGSGIILSADSDNDTLTIESSIDDSLTIVTASTAAFASASAYTDEEISSLDFFKTLDSYPETETISAEGNDNNLIFAGVNNVEVSLSSASNAVLIDIQGDLENITSLNSPNYIQFNTEYVPEIEFPQSSLYWNADVQTLNLSLPNEVVLNVGQQEHYPPVINNSGVQINSGELVMVTGVQGDKLTIAKAVTDGSVSFEYIIGIATKNILNSSDSGTILKFGYVRGLNTSAYDVGTILYPDPNIAGALTDIQPDAPGYRIPIAIVTKQGNSGVILVRMSAPSALGESDSNVQFSGLEDGDFLVYNSGSAIWTNQQIPTTSVQYSTEPPVVEDIGSLWFDPEQNGLYVYDGTYWVNAVGPQGPMGPEGPEGPQGVPGEIGPAPDTSEFLTISSASSTYATIEDLENIDLSPYLTIESASATYATITDLNNLDALPSQINNDGKYLKTDGTTASWETLDLDAKADKNLLINQQAGSYNLQLSDNGKLIEMSGGGNLTVLSDSSANLSVGSQVTILQTGASQVTIVGSGATVNATPGLKLRAQWSSATLIKRAANTWVAIGDLTA